MKARLAFLTKQAEIFQHFGDSKPKKAAPSKKGRGRGARDEDDEDAELLQDEDEAETGPGHRLQVHPLTSDLYYICTPYYLCTPS